MARHNLCLNPALGVNVTGWGGGSTPVRTDVTGLGFLRSWAARYSSGTFASTAATATGAVTVGQTYTLSVYLRTASFSVGSATIYIEWINGSGSGFGYPSATTSAPAGTVTRLSITAAAPAGAVAARAIVDGTNFSVNNCDLTALLAEQSALDTYFDGDTTPGGSWDGTPGLSASTLATGQTITLGRAAETDTGRPLALGKISPLGRATEADTSRTLAVLKSLTPNRAAEANTGRPLQTVKTILLGRATETSTARALTVGFTLTAGRATEADVARPLTVGKTVSIGRATETDTARHLTATGGGAAGDVAIRLGPTRRRWSARTGRR